MSTTSLKIDEKNVSTVEFGDISKKLDYSLWQQYKEVLGKPENILILAFSK